MNTLQHLLYDGSPFARPCDGARNVQTAPIPVVPGTDASLSIAFISPATFRRIPVDEIASGVAAWRFCVADGLGRTKPLLFATDAVTLDLAADTLEIGLAGSWTEQMRAAIGDRPKAVFMAELAGYGSAEDAGTATAPVFSVAFPFCAANRRDDGTGTQPLRDLSIEAHDADATAHPSIRNALAYKADLVDGKVPATQLPASTAPVTSVNNKTGAVTLSASDVGAAASNDPRLSDSRTPLQHASSHKTGGSDALTPSDIGAASTADATLTPTDYGDPDEATWDITYPQGWEYGDLGIFWFDDVTPYSWLVTLGGGNVPSDINTDDPNAASLSFTYNNATATARRTNTPLAYRLGKDAASGGLNADKPVAAKDHPHTTTDITDFPTLATVATSGSYNDLSNKPTIPAAQVQANWNETNTTSKAYIQNKPTIPDVTGKLDATQRNMLPVASPTVSSGAFALDPATAVYRVAASLSGTAATIPTPDATAIPEQSAYFGFELEVTVGSTATTLSGPTGFTWLPDGELPTDPTDFAGKVLHIACRLDCAQGARGVVANLAWIEEVSA